MLYKTFANNSASINGIGVNLNEMDMEKKRECVMLHYVAGILRRNRVGVDLVPIR